MSLSRLARLLLVLSLLGVLGCPSTPRSDDDDSALPGDDDDATGDDDDATGDDDDATGDDDDATGDDDDATGDDDDSAAPDLDGDGVGSDLDCDDDDPANFPGNIEVCDGQDNDCDPAFTVEDWVVAMAAGDDTSALNDVLLGNVYRVDGDLRLGWFEQRLTAPVGQVLEWRVFSSATVGSGWAEIAATSTTVAASEADVMGWHSSGPLDLVLSGDAFYALGVYAVGGTLADSKGGAASVTPFSHGAILGGVFAQGASAPPAAADLRDALAARFTQRLNAASDDDADGDGVPACAGDCNDGEITALPGGTELACDFIDNDCDPQTPDCVGGLVISEVFVNAFGADTDQEWFELHNPGAAPIDLAGWLVRDDDVQDVWIDGPLVIAAGGYLTLAQEGLSSANGGIPSVDYAFGGGLTLSNGEDELRLIAPTGEEIDGLVWAAADFPTQEGASMNLDPGALNATDNDDPANWCSSLAPPYSGNTTGTPGAANANCALPPSGAVAGDLIVTEVLQNPAGDDGGFEWFEIHNTTNAAISLLGWTVSDDGSDAFLITQAVVVPALGYLVLGESSDASVNGGAGVSYGYGGNMVLGNTDDELVITSPEGTEIDRVAWDGGPSFPNPDGAAMTLLPTGDHLDNDSGAWWCSSTTAAYGSNGDLGSPGFANSPCGT